MAKLEYKWIVAIVYVFGLFLQFLDTTIVNAAIPTLASDFHAGTNMIGWVVTGYLLSLAMFIPVSGWLSDRFGTKRTFLFALLIFTAASVLCGIAWSAESLILFRIIQGIGGGLITPVATAMLYRVFPPQERAKVTALAAIPTVIAPTLGPIVGGYFVEFQSWSWIFFINIPIGIIALIIASVWLREQKQSGAVKFDLPGFIFAALALVGIIYFFHEVGSKGFSELSVWLPGAGGLLALIIFIVVELRVSHPIIDIRLFKNKLFYAGNVGVFFNQAIFSGTIFLLPFLLQIQKGLSPLNAGLVTFPTAVGVAMASPLAGRLYHRIGPKRLLTLAMVLASLSSFVLIFINDTTNVWLIRLLMLPRGWSFGMAIVALQTASYASIDSARLSRATAAYSVTSQVGSSFGVALLASVLSGSLLAHHAVPGNPSTVGAAFTAFHETFMVSGLLGILGLAAAMLLDDKLAAHTMKPKQNGNNPVTE